MTEFEPCDDCRCGLDDPEVEIETERVDHDYRVERALRGYILEELGLEDDDTFLKQVTLCPEGIDVAYTQNP